MTIQKDWEGNYFILECDKCGHSEDDFEYFEEAVEFKGDNDWKSVRVDGEWEDRCPDCVDNIF